MKYLLRLYEILKAYWITAWSFLTERTVVLIKKILDYTLKDKSEPTQRFVQEKWHSFSVWKNSLFDKESRFYKPVRTAWRLTLGGIFATFFYLFCVETNFLWLMGSMPSVEDLQNPKVAQSSEIYTADGILLRKLYTENRTPVEYDSISTNVINALIATEDSRFYDHSGIDPKAMGAVAVGILKGDSDRGGGSTITQQLAKKLFKTRRKDALGLLGRVPYLKTVIYKTKEWLTAIKLERNFTKKEIITMYLNTVDYGQNAYGIKTAAKTYFSKTPDNLSIEEAAVLVGLQKATTTYNPIRNPKRSKQRRDVVISQMAKYGFITSSQADSLTALPLALKPNFESPNDEANSNYFVTVVEEQMRKWGEENDYDIYTDGLKIYTTIDSRLQNYAEEAVTEKMRSLQRVFEEHWRGQNPWIDDQGKEIPNFLLDVVKRTKRYKTLSQRFPDQPDSIAYYLNKKDTMTVYDWQTGGKIKKYWSPLDSLNYYKRILRPGLMSMNPHTGQIKAWVGGLDYEFFKYDHVKQGKRQPGSTFKPFIYAAAIDDTTYNLGPCDRMQDKPFEKQVANNGKMEVWRPKNSNGYFSWAHMTLRRAMAQSVNSIAVALTDQIGPATVARYANKLGITTKLDPVLSIGLGTNDVSLYDMVAAYSVFVNGGIYTPPQIVLRVTDRQGNIIHEFIPERKEVLRPESAYLMVHMLKGGVEEPGGTSRGLYSYNLLDNKNEMGGKTGTTSNNSDGWFMNITRDLVTGAWVGGEDRSIHFRSTALGQGSKTALPLVARYLQKAYADKAIGLEKGPFPTPRFELTKEIKCQSYEPEVDEYGVEIDSTYNPNRIEGEFDINTFEVPTTPVDTTRPN